MHRRRQAVGYARSPSFLCLFETMEALGPFPSGTHLLLLIDEKTDLNISTSKVSSAASRPQTFHSDARRVIVATKEIYSGLRRVYASTAGNAGSHYHMMRKLEDASDVLGVELETLEAAVELADLQL